MTGTHSYRAIATAIGVGWMVSLGCQPAPDLPEQASQDRLVTDEVVARIDDYFTDWESKGMSGVFLIAENGVVVFSKGYGMADREAGKPFTPKTVVDIASITKQFTAAAVLKLESEGRLRTTDRISEYFDDVPDDKREITLHQLLSHSAGLPSGIGDDYEDLPNRDEYVERALKAALVAPPGTAWSYSNVGFSLLGAIIEKVTGEEYEPYLRTQFFEPAEMDETGYILPDWSQEDVAVGYVENKRWGTPLDHEWLPDGPGWNLRTNGGILTTVQDMFRWSEALRGDRFLPEAAKKKMWTPYFEVDEEGLPYHHYGYGWGVDTTGRGTLLVQHTGGAAAFDAHYQLWIDEGVVLMMVTSNDDFRSRYLTQPISGFIFGTGEPSEDVTSR